ncbi:MAG: oxygen-independent coproporphyrinogen III oxidase [Pseudomonadota bacterium]|jgi:oxygen-independent coproporphyrinogen-3 oxidase
MSELAFDAELVRRLDRPGPRYTSYPTADRFEPDFTARDYALHARRRHLGGQHRGLALYVHIPFCRTVCFYCACNKIVTGDRTRAVPYLDHLEREIELQAELYEGGGRRLDQVHWGGGSPTFLTVPQMRRLMKSVRRSFRLADDCAGDFAIEIDPRFTKPATVAALRTLGFNRVSLGVQDFDPEVQRKVNRVQSLEETRAVVEAARAERFRSVNLDLIYGLPGQTVMSFNTTLARVVDLAPDRIALYNYAHLPHLFKPQRRIDAADLPGASSRLDILQLAVRRLGQAGYRYIGMDHFARPDDDLSVAQDQGRLRRNFMGYTPHSDNDIIGVGVSAISSVGASYSQNVSNVEAYYEAIAQEELPVARGIELDADDLLRRTVIQGLMCHFLLYVPSIEQAYLIDFASYFARELEELDEFVAAGLVTVEPRERPEWITVTPRGRFLVRNLCMVFDRHLRDRPVEGRYSRTV